MLSPSSSEEQAASTADALVREKASAADFRAALAEFLASGNRLVLPTSDRPRLSILLVLFNRADMTLRCLQSIAGHVPSPFEVVVIDNGSTDETAALLDRVEGAHVGRFQANTGFLHGANTAALAAHGELLLFLNSDVELLPGSVASAVATIDQAPDIGVVGGRLIFPNGTLQEAGSIIWRDGSCQGYGRGDDPDKAEYRFQRDVDFVSGAFLLTRRVLFERLAGFDPAYAPAYYEDADYCIKVWKDGKRVVYAPAAIVVHVEFASSSPIEAAKWHEKHRRTFLERHRGRGGGAITTWAGAPDPRDRRSHAEGGPRVRLSACARSARCSRGGRTHGYGVRHGYGTFGGGSRIPCVQDRGDCGPGMAGGPELFCRKAQVL
jgi:GT2 family glycosyltransferase